LRPEFVTLRAVAGTRLEGAGNLLGAFIGRPLQTRRRNQSTRRQDVSRPSLLGLPDKPVRRRFGAVANRKMPAPTAGWIWLVCHRVPDARLWVLVVVVGVARKSHTGDLFASGL